MKANCGTASLSLGEMHRRSFISHRANLCPPKQSPVAIHGYSGRRKIGHRLLVPDSTATSSSPFRFGPMAKERLPTSECNAPHLLRGRMCTQMWFQSLSKQKAVFVVVEPVIRRRAWLSPLRLRYNKTCSDPHPFPAFGSKLSDPQLAVMGHPWVPTDKKTCWV